MIRPDITSQFYGLGAYYSLSPEAYPLEAIDSLDWVPNSGGAGALATARIDHFEFSGDRAVLSRNGFKSVEQNALTVGGGYGGYSSGERYLIGGNIQASVGPELHRTNYAPINSPPRQQNGLGYSFAFGVDGKFAYRWGGFQAGVAIKANLLSTYIGDTGIQANGIDGDFFALWRF